MDAGLKMLLFLVRALAVSVVLNHSLRRERKRTVVKGLAYLKDSYSDY